MEQNKISQNDNSENIESSNEKIFSQKELDEIIKVRLDRANKKHNEQIEELKNHQGQEINTKLQELEKKENKLECKSYLLDNNLPMEYLDIIDTQNIEEFRNKIDILIGIDKKDESVAPLKSLEGNSQYFGYIDKGFSNSNHKPRRLY